MQNNATIYLSLIRIFCIYWVVLVQHNMTPFLPVWNFLPAVNNESLLLFVPKFSSVVKYISLLTMPLCFFVSGMVLSITNGLNRNACEFALNKVKRILLPCILFGIAFQVLREKSVNVSAFTGYFHLWFLWYLFIFFGVSKIIRIEKIKSKKTICFAIMCLILFPTFLYHIGCGEYGGYFKYYAFFLFGFFFPTSTPEKSWRKIYLGVTMASLVIFISVDVWFSCFEKDLFCRIYEIILCPLVVRCCSFVRPVKEMSFISFIDKNSYGVYIFHAICLYCFYCFGQNVFCFENFGFLHTSLVAFGTVPASICLTLFVRKVFFLRI